MNRLPQELADHISQYLDRHDLRNTLVNSWTNPSLVERPDFEDWDSRRFD